MRSLRKEKLRSCQTSEIDLLWRVPIASPDVGEEEARAVYEVVKSGYIAEGEKVEEFEEMFAHYIGTKHAIACFNGTVGLHLMLLAFGICPGDEVIVPSMTFISTVTSLLYVGAAPVFAEIDPQTLNIDPCNIRLVIEEGYELTNGKKLVNRKSQNVLKAIMPVHYAGQAADMIPILELAEQYDLRVLEDAAEAHGAEYAGKKVGSFGDAAMFSFTPTKNITTAEGGMVTTQYDEIAKRIRLLKNHGQDYQYHHAIVGYNYRMTDIQAALGVEQLKKLPAIIKRKERNARFLSSELDKVRGIVPPCLGLDRTHTYMMYTIQIDSESLGCSRDVLMQRLREKGIQAKIYFPPVHLQPIFRGMGYGDGMLPVTEAVSRRILSLPFHSKLTDQDIRYMVDCIKDCANNQPL